MPHPFTRYDIPEIYRGSQGVGDKADTISTERTIRIPWGSEGKFITVTHDPEAGRARKTFKQWLGGIFNSGAVSKPFPDQMNAPVEVDTEFNHLVIGRFYAGNISRPVAHPNGYFRGKWLQQFFHFLRKNAD